MTKELQDDHLHRTVRCLLKLTEAQLAAAAAAAPGWLLLGGFLRLLARSYRRLAGGCTLTLGAPDLTDVHPERAAGVRAGRILRAIGGGRLGDPLRPLCLHDGFEL